MARLVKALGLVTVVLALAVVGALAGIFFVANTDTVQLKVPTIGLLAHEGLLLESYSLRLSWLLLGSFLLGALLVLVTVVLPAGVAFASQRRQWRRRLDGLRREVDGLRRGVSDQDRSRAAKDLSPTSETEASQPDEVES